MRISQKKACKGCKIIGAIQHSDICPLGYKIKEGENIWSDEIPLEPCPKPRTLAEMFAAYDNYNKSNNKNKEEK